MKTRKIKKLDVQDAKFEKGAGNAGPSVADVRLGHPNGKKKSAHAA